MRQSPDTSLSDSAAAIAALPPPPALPDDAALFLDVDGCLLPFAPRPDAVYVPPELIERLQVLQERLHGALALVSGRSIATLEVPLGILTAVLGAPVFVWLLARGARPWSE